METLPDFEICKRIAEIEGFEKALFEGVEERDFFVKCESFNVQRFNPLTDDGLCFHLMLKHNITFYSKNHIIGNTKYGARKFIINHPKTITDENPNRAICLAIIDANKLK
jgi:hypothetical protein